MSSLLCNCINPSYRSDGICKVCNAPKEIKIVEKSDASTDLVDKVEASKIKRNSLSVNTSKKDTSEVLNLGISSELYLQKIDLLISAQNRTTFAVRAIVRFILIQFTGLSFSFAMWSISNTFIDADECVNEGTSCSGNAFFQVVAVSVYLLTIFVSSRAAWTDLEKSRVFAG